MLPGEPAPALLPGGGGRGSRLECASTTGGLATPICTQAGKSLAAATPTAATLAGVLPPAVGADDGSASQLTV